MKITIYELLGLIQNKKIKEGTKIKCSDFPVAYIYKNGTLGFYNKERFFELTLKSILENMNYAIYEIIEEEKEIEKIKIDEQDRIQARSTGNFVYKVNQPTKNIIYKINELIDVINDMRDKE